MTKEETLIENDVSIDRWPDTKNLILKSMEEYAKQEAIEFITFAANERWYRDGFEGAWYQIPKQAENKSTEELYSLYLQSKQ